MIDTVKYENLIPNVEYTVKGRLMTKDGKDLGITAEQSFKPTNASGNVDMKFTFDAAKLGEEKLLVVFEKLFDKASGKEVTRHEDLNDKEQTISITTPETPKPSVPQQVATGDIPVWGFAVVALGALAIIAGIAVAKRKRAK